MGTCGIPIVTKRPANLFETASPQTIQKILYGWELFLSIEARGHKF
jgi:hypothetical protein